MTGIVMKVLVWNRDAADNLGGLQKKKIYAFISPTHTLSGLNWYWLISIFLSAHSL